MPSAYIPEVITEQVPVRIETLNRSTSIRTMLATFQQESPQVQFGVAADHQGFTYTGVAAATLAAKSAVTANMIVADSTDGTKPAIGVTVLGAASGSPVTIVTHGPAKGVLTSATAGRVQYLDVTGGITATKPATTGHGLQVLGYALNATDLFVAPAFFGTAP